MAATRKIVLVSRQGYTRELDALVADWIQEGVRYVGVIGIDAARLEDIIDEQCVGVGSNPYFMLTASHTDNETIEDAVFLAKQLTEGVGDGPVDIVEL